MGLIFLIPLSTIFLAWVHHNPEFDNTTETIVTGTTALLWLAMIVKVFI